MDNKQKILEAYRETIAEAVFSDKHGTVLSLSGDAIGLINKVRKMLGKKDPHWPDVVMNLKRAGSALQKAQKAAGK